LADFTWWSGLLTKDARLALELAKPQLNSEIIDGKTYWFSALQATTGVGKPAVFLLPAFDEFIISYKDRSAPLALENHKQAISKNGIFKPVLVVNGQVKGLWKRTVAKNKLLVETELFGQLQKNELKLVEKNAAAFGNFLGKEVVVKV